MKAIPDVPGQFEAYGRGQQPPFKKGKDRMLVKEPTSGECADVIAINQLAHAYAHAVSRGLPDKAAQTYAEDGVLVIPKSDPIVGRDAIEATIREGTKPFDMIFHCVQNSVVEVHGDRANACVQLTEWSKRTSDGAGFLWLGFYDDELVRLPEGWRFAKRTMAVRSMAHADVDFKKLHLLTGLRPSLA